jgi:hypothetical protein
MMKTRPIIMLMVLTEFLLIGIAWTEDQEKVIVISDKVGEVIDAQEQKQYNILPAVKNFKSAVFLRLPDGGYVLEVRYEKDGGEKQMRISQTLDDLNTMRRFFGEEELAEDKPELERPDVVYTPVIRPELFSWAGAGAGLGMNGVSGSLSFSHLRNTRLLSLRLAGWSGIIGSPPSLSEIGFMYGVGSKKEFSFRSVSLGLGYIWGTGYNSEDISTIGIPVEAQFFLIPVSFCGMGFTLLSNINLKAPTFGIVLCLRIGKLR